MKKQQGIVHLALPLAVLLILGAVLYFLFYFGAVKNPLYSKLPILGGKKQPTVILQKQYQNPFDKSSQYVNPFSGYRNPFDFLKK